jgi:hypothetical protein
MRLVIAVVAAPFALETPAPPNGQIRPNAVAQRFPHVSTE